MEILTVNVGELARRTHTLPVRHSDTTLGRGLEIGARVIVRDEETDLRWSATVVDLDFEVADTVYALRLGVRLEADDDAAAPGPLLDLLGQLRDGVPAPRSEHSPVTEARSAARGG